MSLSTVATRRSKGDSEAQIQREREQIDGVKIEKLRYGAAGPRERLKGHDSEVDKTLVRLTSRAMPAVNGHTTGTI